MKKRDPKIVIGSPAQGAMSYMGYTESVYELGRKFQKRFWESKIVSLWNEYYVPRARNYMAHVFLQDPEATHLLFIDVDETFQADEIIEMIKKSETRADYHVMCGTGPMKFINWDRVQKMALEGHPPAMLRHASADACNYSSLPDVPGTMKEPFEVRGAGTGLMLIKREVFEGMAPNMEIQRIPAPNRAGRLDAAKFFENSEEDRYQSDPSKPQREMITEDLVFCDKARENGFKIWVDPFVTFGHIGAHIYDGCVGCSNGFYVHEMVKRGD